MKSHTYVAGEDGSRLAQTAKEFGLEEARQPKQRRGGAGGPGGVKGGVFWMNSVLMDDTLTAARMHSVGIVGTDERIDETGALHLVTIRKKRGKVGEAEQITSTQLTDLFGAEDNLFTPPGKSAKEETFVDEEEEEMEEEVIVKGGSLGAAVFGIIKGTVGPAILYLPRGFELSGYAVAVPSMIFATYMFIYNAHRLLECWKVESQRNLELAQRLQETRALLLGSGNDNSSPVRYDGAAPTEHKYTPKLLTYPELSKRALGPYSLLVDFGIASMQFGVCLTYLIFVPQNLYECTKELFGLDLPKIYFLFFMIMIEIPLSWIRDIRKLTPTNVLATILIAYGLCSVLGMAIAVGSQPTEDGSSVMFVENLQNLPPATDAWFMFIGTSFFMMEGSITLIVPLQEAVYRKEDRAKFPMLNQIVTSWIVVFYISFSIVCCAAFGDKIQTALTASLTGVTATITQLAYSIAVILTFPLQAFPAMEVACQVIGINKFEGTTFAIRRNIFATLVTCGLGVIAVVSINYLGNVVSILGSLFGIPLALVFPPIMHNRLVRNSSQSRRLMNYFVMVVGFLAMGLTSYGTITSWDKGAE